jgi:O-methyltransferase
VPTAGRARNGGRFIAMDDATIELEFGSEFLVLWRSISTYTIVSPERAYATYRACRYIARYNIDGCFAECGVFKGGMAMLAALVFAKHADAARDIFLFDTFSGMTAPGQIDMDRHGGSAASYDPEMCKSSLNEVRHNLAEIGYPSHRLHFIEGDVCATLRNPPNVPVSIAILRLDTDWYDSTRAELEILYEKISPGGVVLVDDYGYWLGARKAVDEFIGRLPYPVYLCRTDTTGIEFVKPLGAQALGRLCQVYVLGTR